MRNPRLTRWTNLNKMEGLLLVAQQLQECLSDYSLDSYKTPALNTHTRCLELLWIVQDVERGVLSQKNLRPVVEELANSVAKDHAVRTLLGTHARRLATFGWWQVEDPRRLKVQGNFLRGLLTKRRYETELISQLTTLVQDPKQKDRITETVTNLAVEWMHFGFSRDYIYTRAKSFFFGLSSTTLNSPSQIGQFLAMLKPREREFDVCFRVSSPWAALLPKPIASLIEVTKVPPAARAGLPLEKGFLLKGHLGAYALLKGIKALDARSARNRAFDRLAVLADFGACHMHRSPLSWDGEALVWENLHPLVLKQSLPPIHKEDECHPDELSARFGEMIGALDPERLPPASQVRLTSALGLHSSALRTEDVSVQLSTLWAALEALLPASADDSKIGSVSEALLPVLSHGYPAKLLKDLSESLKSCCGAPYASALAAVKGDDPEMFEARSYNFNRDKRTTQRHDLRWPREKSFASTPSLCPKARA